MKTKLDEGLISQGLKWFSSKIKKSANTKQRDDSGDIMNMKDVTNKMRFFNLYTTIYKNPKYKKELPYYDAFPLFFPFDIKQGSEGSIVHAINIHYLPPALRMKFLKELEAVIRREALKRGYDPNHLENYPIGDITKNIGRYMNSVYTRGGGSAGSMIRQCYRSYFFGRMSGKLTKIDLDEWSQAGRVFLPAFRKESSSEIYKDIREKYRLYISNPRKDIR